MWAKQKLKKIKPENVRVCVCMCVCNQCKNNDKHLLMGRKKAVLNGKSSPHGTSSLHLQSYLHRQNPPTHNDPASFITKMTVLSSVELTHIRR